MLRGSRLVSLKRVRLPWQILCRHRIVLDKLIIRFLHLYRLSSFNGRLTFIHCAWLLLKDLFLWILRLFFWLEWSLLYFHCSFCGNDPERGVVTLIFNVDGSDVLGTLAILWLIFWFFLYRHRAMFHDLEGGWSSVAAFIFGVDVLSTLVNYFNLILVTNVVHAAHTEIKRLRKLCIITFELRDDRLREPSLNLRAITFDLRVVASEASSSILIIIELSVRVWIVRELLSLVK